VIKIRASTARRLGMLAVGVVTLTAAMSGWQPALAASSGTLSVSPSVASVLAGGNFTVSVMQTSTATTSGAQADVVFDNTKVQVTNVTRGAAYIGPPLSGATIGLGPLDTGTFKADAMAIANASGTLQGTAVYYNPPGGDPTVPTGAHESFVVSFHATSAVTVASAVGLNNGEMLDAAGNGMIVTIASPAGSLRVTPATQTVSPGSTFIVTIRQTAPVPSKGAQTDLSFDQTKAQIVSIAAGAAYVGNDGFVMGVAPQTPAQAIALANTTGTLPGIAAYFGPSSATVPAGDQEFLVIHMKAQGNSGTTPLTLGNREMLDAGGLSLVTGSISGTATMPPFINPGVGLPCSQNFVGDANGDG
jgi:hypothetical protein